MFTFGRKAASRMILALNAPAEPSTSAFSVSATSSAYESSDFSDKEDGHSDSSTTSSPCTTTAPTPVSESSPSSFTADSIIASTPRITTSTYDDEDDDEEDPDLGHLALAIAQTYTPSSTRPYRICSHGHISRVRTSQRCYCCCDVHPFGWLYRCALCGHKVCHDCRPRFAERSWGSLGGMVEEIWGEVMGDGEGVRGVVAGNIAGEEEKGRRMEEEGLC